MKTPNQKRRSKIAFTLVEILIAIGIVGLVLTAIYSTWTAILRASRVGLEAAAAVQRSRITVRVLEDSLGSCQSFAQGQRYYSFVAENGNDATLSFVARLAKSFPRGGKFGDLDVRRITFSVESGTLVMRQNPVLMEIDDEEKTHPLVLAKNVKKFAMEFWDPKLNDWTDEWKMTNQIPKAVKIDMQLAQNEKSQSYQEIMRIISLPSVMVQAAWQMGGAMPGQPPFGNPGGPGGPQPPTTIPPTRPGQLPEIKPGRP
jgi:type II secretion system protein J